MTDHEIMQLAKQEDWAALANYFFYLYIDADDDKKRSEANRQWAVMPAGAQCIVGKM